MPLYRAKQLCPNLLVVPPDGARYRECSAMIFAVLEAVGTPFESLSLDEAYLDLGDRSPEESLDLVVALRREVHSVSGLTMSAGLGSSKLIAKIASDVNKPDGLTYVEPGDEAAFLHPLPIGRLYGIGPKSERRFIEAGITTIGMLAESDDATLAALLGRSAQAYRDLARGIDDRVVAPYRERKSISSETTFETNLQGEGQLFPILIEQAQELAETLQRKQLRAQSVTVKIKRPDFQVSGKQTSLREPTNDARLIFAAARFCLRQAGFHTQPIRLIGTKVAELTGDTTRQLPLW